MTSPKTAQRTPGPWQRKQLYADVDRARVKPWEINDAKGRRIAAGIVEEADAAFIVKACNAHDALVEALRQAQWHIGTDEDRRAMDPNDRWRTSTEDAANLIRAALKALED
jgi:hypothetical protein